MGQRELKVNQVEAAVQAALDEWYRELGWKPFDRQHHNTKWDLRLRIAGAVWTAEEKIRQRVWADIAVEIWEGMPGGHAGWLRYTDAHRLLYVMCRGIKPCVLFDFPWRRFQRWVVDWMVDRGQGNWICSDKGDQGPTLSVVVPIHEIPDSLYRRYVR